MPIISSQQNVGGSLCETHAVGDSHGLPHPVLQAWQGVRGQYAAGCSPGRGHHGAAGATKPNGVVLFTTTNPHRPAQSVSEPTKPIQIVPPVTYRHYGTTRRRLTARAINKDVCSTRAGESSAGTSNGPGAVQAKGTTTNIQAAETPTTEPRNVPSASALSVCLRSRALTPYKADGWHEMLIRFRLSHKHPALLEQLMHGFRVWAPTITRSFTPPNNPSINVHHDTFNKILHKEFTKQRYIGPFT
jgi:hypothetical protein